MIKHYSIFAKWRKKDIIFLKQFNLNRDPKEGYFGFSLKEGELFNSIVKHYSKPDTIFHKTRPSEFSCDFVTVSFSTEELESAKSYTLHLGLGKLEVYWPDSREWKSELYGGVCPDCEQPLGEQQKPWVLKRDFKNFEKHPFVSFEGLGGFVFCGKELAGQMQKEFGIGHMPVLIGKKRSISEHLVQLKIPLAPCPLRVDGNEFGRPYEGNDTVLCSTCNQRTYTNQTLDFFPTFEKEFEFDLVLTHEWFGWFRRIVVSRRFLDFCFKLKILKKWGHDGAVIPQTVKKSITDKL